MPRIELDWKLAGCLCLALLFGACFRGDFAQGLPCSSDADCGPALSCMQGFCGGPGGSALCGNGLLEVGEQCDDGNIDEGDACTPACLAPVCGDGFFAPGELCDDGNTNDTDGCPTSCSVCGNGVVESAEECDDNNTLSGDVCTPSCRFPICGDGFVALGEICDDGNEVWTDDCTPLCVLPACGDGVINGDEEICDDGNEIETDDCTTECSESPETPVLELSLAQVKQFQFSWETALGVEYYQLFERADVGEEFVQIGGDIAGDSTSISLTMPLLSRLHASYMLRGCNANRCADSEVVDVVGTLAEAVGYFKASNTNASQGFGGSVAISADGRTLAVGAPNEASSATGIDGDETDVSAPGAGAVYVFQRQGDDWSQQAYIKASNTEAGDSFGYSVALSSDGDTMAVGAPGESVNGLDRAGAIHVFVRHGESWTQQVYGTASNPTAGAEFGIRVALSNDGNTMATIAEVLENSDGVWGDAYVFVRENESWSQQKRIPGFDFFYYAFAGDVALSGDGHTLAVGSGWEAGEFGTVEVYVRSDGDWLLEKTLQGSNTNYRNLFGSSVALSDDGDTLAVGAVWEDSSATGIDGDQTNDYSLLDRGAAYVFRRDDQGWSQQAYVKASNTGDKDYFGGRVVLSGDGDTLAVAAIFEDSNAMSIGGDPSNDSALDAGAVYVFVYDGQSWSQQAYVKASNTKGGDAFGSSVALADDDTLVVGSPAENNYATGVGNEPTAVAFNSGAVYLY